MPTDTRRNNGPEDSTPYQHFIKQPTEKIQPPSMSSWKRKNERKPDECRPLYTRLGTVVHAQGSCYLEAGASKVVAAVYGPRSLTKSQQQQHSTGMTSSGDVDRWQLGQLTCEVTLAAFCRADGRVPPARQEQDRELSQELRTALEPSVCLHKFPSLCCSVYVLVLEDDGGALSAATVASSLALCDAGVPVYDMVACCTMLKCKEAHLVDPDAHELATFCGNSGAQQSSDVIASAATTITLAYMPQLDQISNLSVAGWIEAATVGAAVIKLTQQCRDVHVLMRNTLLDKIDADSRPQKDESRDKQK